MLLICPVRLGDTNEELRHALRSWERNLLLDGGLELMTVGYKPSWLDPDIHIEGNAFTGAPANVFSNIVLGSSWALDQDEVVYMNDDFFCLDPVLRLPVYRRNRTLAQHIEINARYSHVWFIRSLVLTASFLAGRGYPSPWSYEVHRPLLAKPEAMLLALGEVDFDPEVDLPQWRTLYGALNDVDAVPVDDVKVGSPTTSAVMPLGSPWLSTSDSVWHKYGRGIRERFQKPSRWENGR